MDRLRNCETGELATQNRHVPPQLWLVGPVGPHAPPPQNPGQSGKPFHIPWEYVPPMMIEALSCHEPRGDFAREEGVARAFTVSNISSYLIKVLVGTGWSVLRSCHKDFLSKVIFISFYTLHKLHKRTSQKDRMVLWQASSSPPHPPQVTVAGSVIATNGCWIKGFSFSTIFLISYYKVAISLPSRIKASQ